MYLISYWNSVKPKNNNKKRFPNTFSTSPSPHFPGPSCCIDQIIYMGVLLWKKLPKTTQSPGRKSAPKDELKVKLKINYPKETNIRQCFFKTSIQALYSPSLFISGSLRMKKSFAGSNVCSHLGINMCYWLASPALSFCPRGATGQNDCLEWLLMDLQQQSFPRQGLCAACAFSVPPTRGTYCSQLKHSPNSASVQQKRLRRQYWFHELRIKITRHCLTRGIRKLWPERFNCLQCQQMPATSHGAQHSFDTEGTTRGTKIWLCWHQSCELVL